MKRLLFALLAIVPALAFAQEDYTIKGKIGKHNAPAKVFLEYVVDGDLKLDSVEVKDGEFSFSGSVETPIIARLILSPEGKGMKELKQADFSLIYLSKGMINVSGESLKLATLSGNPLLDDYVKFKSLRKDTDDAIEAVKQEFSNASDAQKKDKSYVESLRSKLRPLYNKIDELNKNFIKLSTSYISLILIDENLNAQNVLEYEEHLKKLSIDLLNSARGKSIQERINYLRTVATGVKAPEFTLPDVNDKDVSLASFQGQYVLIDFWASWCGPCRAENPHVVAAYNKFKDKGFTILGVSLDYPGDKEAWLKAIEKDQLGQWTNVSDLKGWESEVVKLYSVRGIPQNFLLDKEGKIIASNLRGDALEAKLAEIFN